MDMVHGHMQNEIHKDHAHQSFFSLTTFFGTITNPDFVWVFFITSLIGLVPILCVFVMPSKRGTKLDIALGFASGGLLGDAFLHLIPHALSEALESHSHENSHGEGWSKEHEGHGHGGHHGPLADILFCCLMGLVAFWILERILDSITEEDHANNHNQMNKKPNVDQNPIQEVKIKTSIIILNLVADFVHNITDGLAIGASFAADRVLGYQTAIAIFVHEIPHEIGDYAILMDNGVSRSRAAVYQAITATGAVCGSYIGFLGDRFFDNSWVIPFTAGGFIYIACASVMPALSSSGPLQNLCQCFALLAGIGLMVLVTELEEYLE